MAGITSKVFKTVRNIHLIYWIFFGIIIGALCGVYAPQFSIDYMGLLLNAIFLPMVKTIIVPLIFSTLVTGIASHEDINTVGRLGLKSITYFMTLTIAAVFIGLAFGLAFQPGVGVDLGTKLSNSTAKAEVSLETELKQIIPESFFRAASENKTLQIVFCAVMFAVALILSPNKKMKKIMVEFNESLSLTMFKVTDLVMNFIPFAVAGAVALVIAKNGATVFVSLAKLVGCVYVGLLCFVVLLILMSLALKIPIFKLIVHLWEPISIAFLTSSSEAVLPLAMEKMIEFGVPPPIVSFVIPTGYSFNLDGTTLYLGAASMFLMQASPIERTIGDQVVVILTMMIMAKGVAGVPRASLALLIAGVDMFGFPPEGIAAIAAVDFIMDMARTAMNLFGNCLASVVIAKWEGEYPSDVVDEQITVDLESSLEKNK